jgi:DNA mismatch repair protein MutS
MRGEKDLQTTPMIRQYRRIKERYKDVILLFRLGDFYETFNEDAEIASKVLDIVLTSRLGMPMAGFPYHAANSYIGRLVRAGYKVAICEQIEGTRSKALMDREVVRIITPGTALDEDVLEGSDHNYLSSILPLDLRGEEAFGLSYIDVSTGDFATTEIRGPAASAALASELSRLKPAECIIPDGIQDSGKGVLELLQALSPGTMITRRPTWEFDPEEARNVLMEHFGVQSLEGFGCDGKPLAIGAAGAIISYLREVQKGPISQISSLSTYHLENFMVLDPATQRNLDLVVSSRDGSRNGTLLELLDRTMTPMGKRTLKDWILRPLVEVHAIRERLDAVEELVSDMEMRSEVRTALKGIHDLERLSSRVGCGSGGPKDMINLKKSIGQIQNIISALKESKSKLLSRIVEDMDPLTDLFEEIDSAIEDKPMAVLGDGELIKRGYDEELDMLRDMKENATKWLLEFERRERKRTGISSLKVGYNNIFGYYIEVTKPNLHLVPQDYQRKQTLVNAERFVTQELKEYEERITGSEERIAEIEKRIFNELKELVAKQIRRIKRTSSLLGILDALQSLAQVAVENNYVKPEVDDGEEIRIIEGRHPVVERTCDFVPNDAMLDCTENQLLIITGPNMAGKSTYIRQVALIVLMAQMGSFVPASEAKIGVVDRIFTRIGASDNIAMGQSTFLVEMNETANILNNATRRSLIILDEIGRGTSTFDGLSIAWAVGEYIHDSPRLGAKTLFATHFHELILLGDRLPKAKNYSMAVREWRGNVIFLRKVVPGGSDKSYGIAVAKLAGLPQKVIDRAKEILSELERRGGLPRRRGSDFLQLKLFQEEDEIDPLIEELLSLDVSRMTPLEALNKLYELQRRARGEG